MINLAHLKENFTNNFNIKDFGAIGDGIHKNTIEINNAIQSASNCGGGNVIIPQGVWHTTSLQLKSNVNIHLEEGAIVSFSSAVSDYPLIASNYEGISSFRCMPQIYGENLENISITGKGVFDGNGGSWRPVKKSKVTENHWNGLLEKGGCLNENNNIWWPSREAHSASKTGFKNFELKDFEEAKVFFRPVLLGLTNCKNILLKGITFQNSAAWCLHPRLCENILVQTITVKNPWFSQNGDGLDLESCKYAIIENSTFDVGDDAICMKSGKDDEGRKLGVATEQVIVRNCTVYHGHGGFTVGSEMSGGVKDILLQDCTFLGTDVGLRFKSCRGRGGIVENIVMERVTMKDIGNQAITFNTYYAANGKPDDNIEISEKTPIFRNIQIKDVVCSDSKTAIEITGLPEMPIKDISFENVTIKAEIGITCKDAENIEFNNVNIVSDKGNKFDISNIKNVTFDKKLI